MLLNFFKISKECKHLHVPVDVEEAYCPDCGQLVKNKWYLVRCSCCNIKRNARFEYDKIKTDTKFCPNCGSTEFYVEELDNIDCSNMHYVLFKKVIVEQGFHSVRQLWIEEEDELCQQKLLEARV